MIHDKELNYFTVQEKDAVISFEADSISLYRTTIEYENDTTDIPLLLEGHQVDAVINNLKKLPNEQHTISWLNNVVTGCIYITLKCPFKEEDLWKQPLLRRNSITSVPA